MNRETAQRRRRFGAGGQGGGPLRVRGALYGVSLPSPWLPLVSLPCPELSSGKEDILLLGAANILIPRALRENLSFWPEELEKMLSMVRRVWKEFLWFFFPLFSFHFVTKVDPFVESRNSADSLKSSFVARNRKRGSERAGRCGVYYREKEAARRDCLVLRIKCLTSPQNTHFWNHPETAHQQLWALN